MSLYPRSCIKFDINRLNISLICKFTFDRKYTLERMFTNQLLESAKDELSFRTVVRDLHTKCPMLKIVLLNTNSWSCTGYCFGTVEQVSKIDLYPTIKVLFSDCCKCSEIELRLVDPLSSYVALFFLTNPFYSIIRMHPIWI